MGTLAPTVAVVFAGVLGLLLALVGASYLRTYVRLKRMDPVGAGRVGDPSSAVELAGTARVHKETSRAPFTGTESLLHQWTVERLGSRPGGGERWRRLASGEELHPFALADGTGAVLVDPDGAQRELTRKASIEVDPAESAPAEVAAFLESTDEVDRDHSRKHRYRESRLEPGDDVHVLGPVRESGHSFDLPGSVDAVVGVENPEERRFTVGEDGLSDLLEKVRSDYDRFVLTTADERDTERHMLGRGALWLGVGVFFLAVPVAIVLV